MTIEQPEPRGVSWCDRHVFVDGVVVEIETDLVTVELDGAVEVTDGNDDYFEGPVHETAFR